MKVLAVFAMFAFVAVQLSQAAPAEEEKRDAPLAPEVAAAADSTSQPIAEAKAATPEAAANPADAPQVEEKKA